VKVALYYPWVYLTSGAERTILELTGRSRHTWTVFTNRYEPENTFPGFAQRHVVALAPVPVKRTFAAVARAGLRLLTQKLPLSEFDALVIVCEGLGSFVAFRAPRIPIINVCLTPLRIAYDPQYRQVYGGARGLSARAAVALACAVYRPLDRLAWRRYDQVFCISEEVRRRVVRGRLAPEERLEVVHVGLGFMPTEPTCRADRYFLLPGRMMWTKNIELGVRAFRSFLARSPAFSDFRLIIAGIVDQKSRPYLARLRELAGGEPRVEFRIHPSDEELHELYANCYATLFTAFNEDWGIVPIEGMAFCKPAIACNRGGPRESIQPGVQGFLEEPDPERFAARMAELASDPQLARRMGLAGRERAKLFTWDRLTERVDLRIEELTSARGSAAAWESPVG